MAAAGRYPALFGDVGAKAFVSYAQDHAAQVELVRRFAGLLRAHGIEVGLDLDAAAVPRDWPLWMRDQLARADFVLVIASAAYKRRAEGGEAPGVGLGASWEGALIREYVYADRARALARVLPVVLPGWSRADIPDWLGPNTRTHYAVSELTAAGAAPLLAYLTGGPHPVTPAAPAASTSYRSMADQYHIGGDYVAGDKNGGDNIIGGAKHVHVYRSE